MGPREIATFTSTALDRNRNLRQATMLLLYASRVTRDQSVCLREASRELIRRLPRSQMQLISKPVKGVTASEVEKFHAHTA